MSNANAYNFYFSRNVQKQLHIKFTDNGTTYDIDNSKVVSEQISLDENLCSDENLRFGACESSVFKAQVISPIDSLVGKTIDVYMTVDNTMTRLVDDDGNFIVDEDGNYVVGVDGSASPQEIYIGLFKVYSDKPVADRSWRDIEAYDLMYDLINLDVSPWYNSQTFPMTIYDMRTSLFAYARQQGVNVTEYMAALPNDSMNVQGGFTVEGSLSFKQVIEAICELNGVFGHIRKGERRGNRQFEYKALNDFHPYTPEWYIDGSGSYEDYEVETITGIIARDSENDSGTTVGTTVNPYTIENNPLIYGMEGTQALNTILANLLDAIDGITYRPYQVSAYGNPKAYLGDPIRIVTRNQTINSYILHRSLSGVQAMQDTYSATGEQKQTSSINSISSQITRTKGKVHIIQNDVNGLHSTVTDIRNDLTTAESEISQLAGEIVLKVDNDGNLVEVSLSADPSTGSTFQVSADNIDFVANDVMQFTTGVLGINSDNFTIDKTTGAVAIDGSITAETGLIGGFTISSTTNQGTSEQGGHYYKNSLYTHITDSANGYEYEIGLQGGGTSPTSIAFYVYRIAQGAAWSTATPMFKVLKNGTVDLAGSINADSLKVVDKIQLRSAQISNYNFVQNYYSAEDWGAYINNTAGSHAIRIVGYSAGEWDGYMGALIGKWKIGNYDIAYKTTSGNISSYWGIIPVVGSSDGVMEIGRYLDFHRTSSNVADFTFRLDNSANGTLAASGTITQGSSRKIKENIEDIPIEEAEKILELEPVRFDYINGAKDRRGFIAEDVAEVLPNLVTPEEEDIPASLDYNGIIPYLVKMVQKQQKEIDELKDIIKRMEG